MTNKIIHLLQFCTGYWETELLWLKYSLLVSSQGTWSFFFVSITWTHAFCCLYVYMHDTPRPYQHSTWAPTHVCHNAPRLCYLSPSVPTQKLSGSFQKPDKTKLTKIHYGPGTWGQGGCSIFGERGYLCVLEQWGGPKCVIHFSLSTPEQSLSFCGCL